MLLTLDNSVDKKEEFKEVEKMTRFPGCEDKGSEQTKKKCPDGKLLRYIYRNIYRNLKYPEEAKKNGIEGIAIISFVVEKDGSLSNIEIKKDPGQGTGEAARQVVMDMNNLAARWIPGEQKGKPTSVQYTLPIKFKL